MTIPKKIHYVWLGGKKKPADIAWYMSSWHKHFPEYTIQCWDEHSFDIEAVPFVKESIESKKWAFASDYIRLYALYTEGGIYFDTDVFVTRSFKDLIKDYQFISAVEYYPLPNEEERTKRLDSEFHRNASAAAIPGIGLQSAFMASVPGHPFLADCMNWYKDRHLIFGGALKGYKNTEGNTEELVAPDIYAQCAEKYGFIYKDIEQRLEHNMLIFPSSISASSYSLATKKAYLIHCCTSTWRKNKIVYTLKRFAKIFLMLMRFRAWKK